MINAAEFSESEFNNIAEEIKHFITKQVKVELNEIKSVTNGLRKDFDKLAEEMKRIKKDISNTHVTEPNDKMNIDPKEIPVAKTKHAESDVMIYNSSDLEDRVEILEIEVSTLQAALEGVAGEVDDLEADQTSQDDRMNNIESEVSELQSGYVDLLMRVDTTEEDVILHGAQINVLENKVGLVSEEVTLIDGRVTLLESANEDIMKTLQWLQESANDTSSRTEALENTAVNHDEQLSILTSNVTTVSEDIVELHYSVDGNKNDITGILNRLTEVESIVGLETIAFHAYGEIDAPVPGQIVVFDTPILNLGNCYNASSGIFTAPQHGVYFFSMKLRNLRSGADHDMFYIYKDGVNKCNGATDGETEINTIVDATCSAIIEMQSGDEVYVFANANADSRFDGIATNFFMGFLVRAFAG